jgi:hypothetical protein
VHAEYAELLADRFNDARVEEDIRSVLKHSTRRGDRLQSERYEAEETEEEVVIIHLSIYIY